MCQAVPGATPGIQNASVRWAATTSCFIAGTPQEDPAVISEAADIVMYADEAEPGRHHHGKVRRVGHRRVHALLLPAPHGHGDHRRPLQRSCKANAEALGIEFVDVTAPDPTGEAGTSGAQQFILEDVPAAGWPSIAGKKVAFFTTNCSMQPALQAAVLDLAERLLSAALLPEPLPWLPGHPGPGARARRDDEAALKAIAAEAGRARRGGPLLHLADLRWPCPSSTIGVEYAQGLDRWATITDRNDAEILMELFDARRAPARNDRELHQRRGHHASTTTTPFC